MNWKIKFILVSLGIVLIIPILVFAQEIDPYKNIESEATGTVEVDDESFSVEAPRDTEIFKAQVIEIIKEQEKIDEKGNRIIQQNLKLRGLTGSFKNKEFIFDGIGKIEVIANQVCKKGDKVIVNYEKDMNGEDVFYVIDFVRTNNIYLLTFIFVLVILFVGRFKGLRAIISLFITFFIILKFILPSILNGANPVLISIIGAFIILIFIIYITEGFNKKSHLAVFSVLISLIITGILSVIFVNLMKLTGVSEESLFLVSLAETTINFKGILLAGVIIGSLGVLDDMVVSQISAVQEIKKSNLGLSNKDVFKKAYKIGVSHISSMTNTLFLAYAGTSLTILLLFSLKIEPFMSFTDILNNNLIATEILRGLVGGIGLALSMPISTFLASYYLRVKS